MDAQVIPVFFELPWWHRSWQRPVQPWSNRYSQYGFRLVWVNSMSFSDNFRIFWFSQKVDKKIIFLHFAHPNRVVCDPWSNFRITNEIFPDRLSTENVIQLHHFMSQNISRSELTRNHYPHCTRTLGLKYHPIQDKLNHFWRQNLQLSVTFICHKLYK